MDGELGALGGLGRDGAPDGLGILGGLGRLGGPDGGGGLLDLQPLSITSRHKPKAPASATCGRNERPIIGLFEYVFKSLSRQLPG
jgi:hypothetical protein